MNDASQQSPDVKPESTVKPGILVLEFIVIVFLFGIVYLKDDSIRTQQQTIDSYKDLVKSYQKRIAWNDTLLARKDSVIDLQHVTIKNYERLTDKYEKMISANIAYLKLANQNAQNLITAYRLQQRYHGPEH